MKCDFCSSTPVARTYARPDVILNEAQVGDLTVQQVSTGGWAACSVGARLIDAEDRDGLALRSFETLRHRRPELRDLDPELVARFIDATHGKFWALEAFGDVRVTSE